MVCVCVPRELPVNVDVAVCVWTGIFAADSVTVLAPPVDATGYVSVAPTTNRSRRSGVPDAPLHNTHPLGTFADVPDHTAIVPDGTNPSWTAHVLT